MKKMNKKGQMTLSDAPTVVLLVGLVFLLLATTAFIGEKYGESIRQDNIGDVACGTNSTGGSDGTILYTNCGAAYNVTVDLNTEISNNTSIAGIVLTISLVGIVLTVLVSVFMAVKRRNI